jgi:GDPmannose 4,6-dehydratase
MNGPVVIYGAGGQDGQYMRKHYQEAGVEIVALERREQGDLADVSNRGAVMDLVKRFQPEIIYHFAANSTTRHEAMMDHHTAIAGGTVNLLEAVSQHSPHTKLFLSGSALQFENRGVPISEADPFRYVDPYSIARNYSVHMGRYYRQRGIKVYVGYFFHHESPSRPERHMSQRIARAAARIAKGSQETLEVGDLNVVKEWGLAGDIMEGARVLVSQDEIYEAVIGTGEGHSLQEWAELCFRHFGLQWEEHVRETKRFEPEYRHLVSYPARIKGLGWAAMTTFENLAESICEQTDF